MNVCNKLFSCLRRLLIQAWWDQELDKGVAKGMRGKECEKGGGIESRWGKRVRPQVC